MKDSLETKADVESPTFKGTPKAPTPTSSSSDDQIATVGFVKGKASGFIGSYITGESHDDQNLGRVTRYASYTAKNDCFITYHVIMDCATNFQRTPNVYLVLNGQAISSTKTAYRANVANDFFFQGPVKKGTTLWMDCPGDVSYHQCSWIVAEFEY